MTGINKFTKTEEELARNLHQHYLNATAKLSPEDYNHNAQKNYDDMSDNQKFIDLFIARKLLQKPDQSHKSEKHQVLTYLDTIQKVKVPAIENKELQEHLNCYVKNSVKLIKIAVVDMTDIEENK